MNSLLLLSLLSTFSNAALLEKRQHLVSELFQEVDYTYAVGYAPDLVSTTLIDASTYYFTSVIDIDLGTPTVESKTFSPTGFDIATLHLFSESNAATELSEGSSTAASSIVTSLPGTNVLNSTTTLTSSTVSTNTSTIATDSSTPTSSIDESVNDYNSTSFSQDILYEHNVKRQLHGVPPLTWSTDLAQYAQAYADSYTCPSNGTLTHSGGPFGENLASGFSSAFATVDAWYDEISLYNFAAPGFSEATGHFSQVVWRDTTQVGCAYHACDTAYHTYVICSYSPAGNVINSDWIFEVPELLNFP